MKKHLLSALIVANALCSDAFAQSNERLLVNEAVRSFDFIVAKDGTGNGKTIQSALNSAPNDGSRFLIFVKNGIYEEGVSVTRDKVSIIGQDPDSVIVRYHSNNGVSSTVAALIVNGNHFYTENITWQDPRTQAQANQAPAHLDKGKYNAYKNTRFRGQQDTEVTGDNGLQYYHKCYFEGTVDFICGGGTMFFDTCTLFCLGAEVGRNNGSVICAPATRAESPYGYVFNRCTIKGGSGQSGRLQLGRPWKNAPRAVYLNTIMEALPTREGWADMQTAPSLFAEYRSVNAKGDTVNLKNRKKDYFVNNQKVGTSQTVLSAEEAAEYTLENVLGKDWSPLSITKSTDAPRISLDNGTLIWDTVEHAVSYVIFRENEMVGFTTEHSFIPPFNDSAISYTVRAATEYGALSAISNAVIRSGISASVQISENTDLGVVFYANNGTLYLKQLPQNALVELFDLSGQKLFSQRAKSSEMSIPAQGLVIVNVRVAKKTQSCKIFVD